MLLRCVQIQLPCSRSSAAEVSRSKHHGCHNYHNYHHDNKHEHNDDFWLSSWTFKFFQHMVGSPKNEFKHETVSEENLPVAPTLEIFNENSTLNLYTLPETNIFRRKQAFCPKGDFMTPNIRFSRVFVIVLWRALQMNLVLVCVFEDLNTVLPHVKRFIHVCNALSTCVAVIKRMFIIFLRERMLLGGGFNVCQMFTPKMGKLIKFGKYVSILVETTI